MSEVAPPSPVPVGARIFASTGAFFVVTAIVYGLLADESSGVVLLLAAGAFSAVVAGFLAARGAGRTTDTRPDLPDDRRHEPFFPDRSLWPLGVGLGLGTALAGLALGLPVLIVGVVLLVRSVVGWAYQSKDPAA